MYRGVLFSVEKDVRMGFSSRNKVVISIKTAILIPMAPMNREVAACFLAVLSCYIDAGHNIKLHPA